GHDSAKCQILRSQRAQIVSSTNANLARAVSMHNPALYNGYKTSGDAAIQANDIGMSVNNCPPVPPVGFPPYPTSVTAQTVTVKPGDTLSSIAAQSLGDPGAFMKIFNANQALLSNPNLIHPGQVLIIPTT